jgi:NAD(P)H-dependent FMN reductase
MIETATRSAPLAEPLRIAVIVGSTRPGRRGDMVARWFVRHAGFREGLVVDLIDLADVDLPAVLPSGDHRGAADLVGRVEEADAFVVVTPEYNHGYPASLKQAIDVPYADWNAKPLGFVSYGGMSGGSRAVEQLRQVFAELHVVTVRDVVAFPGTRFDVHGEPEEAPRAEKAADVMLDRLTWWARALRSARSEHPYGR